MGACDFFWRRANRTWRSCSTSGGASIERQMYLRLSNSIGICLGDLTQFFPDPIHFDPEVILGYSEDLFHFVVASIFQIEHRQGFFDFGQPVDGGVEQLYLLVLCRRILDILPMGRQPVRVHRSDQAALFSE